MIRRVFDIYVEQAPVLMPAAAVVFVFTGLSTAPGPRAPGWRCSPSLICLVATDAVHGDGRELVADVQDGRRDATAGQLLRAAAPVLGQLILVGVLAASGS